MVPATGKTTSPSNNKWWPAAPVMQANATGIIERGENSNNNNSMAKKTAAMGLPKIADIPAVAPAASRIFLSLSVILSNWPNVEPNAPPVAMMGPSAPNGPPVPIEMAEDSGLR